MQEKLLQLSEKALNALTAIIEDKSIDARIRIEAIQMAMDYAHPFLFSNNPEHRSVQYYKEKNFFPRSKLHHGDFNSEEDVIRF